MMITEEIIGTIDEYNEMIIKEVWKIPGAVLPQVVKIVHSLNVGGR